MPFFIYAFNLWKILYFAIKMQHLMCRMHFMHTSAYSIYIWQYRHAFDIEECFMNIQSLPHHSLNPIFLGISAFLSRKRMAVLLKKLLSFTGEKLNHWLRL